jgi:hypothetical protein
VRQRHRNAAAPANQPAIRRQIDHQLGAQPSPVLLAMAQSKWHGSCCDCPGTGETFDGDEAARVSQGGYWFHRQLDSRSTGKIRCRGGVIK